MNLQNANCNQTGRCIFMCNTEEDRERINY